MQFLCIFLVIFSEISNQKNSIDNLEIKNRKRERKKQEVKENQVKSTELPLDTIDFRLVFSDIGRLTMGVT